MKLSSVIPSAAETELTVRNFRNPSVIRSMPELRTEIDLLNAQIDHALRCAIYATDVSERTHYILEARDAQANLELALRAAVTLMSHMGSVPS